MLAHLVLPKLRSMLWRRCGLIARLAWPCYDFAMSLRRRDPVRIPDHLRPPHLRNGIVYERARWYWAYFPFGLMALVTAVLLIVAVIGMWGAALQWILTHLHH